MDRSARIIRCLNGKASREEQQELYQQMAADDTLRQEFEDIRLLYEAPGPGDVSVADFYHDLQKIQSGMQHRMDRRRNRVDRRWQMALALSLIGNITMWLLVYPATESNSPLLFSRMPLKEVVNVLASKYQIVIELDHDASGACLFSGAFYHIDKGEDVIASLAKAMNLESRQLTNGHYRLAGAGCQ